MLIMSESNSRIKYIRRLYQSRFRKNEGKYIIEGVRFVEEAISSGQSLDFVVYTSRLTQNNRGKNLLNKISKLNVPLLETTEAIFKEITDTNTPQGVLAVVRAKNLELDEILQTGQNHLLILVDGVQDPGNLGTIIRTADAAGATGVILAKGTVDLYNPKTLRATMGAVFHLPVVISGEVGEVSENLLRYGLRLVIGSPHAKQTIYNASLTEPVVLVVGSEANGVSENIKGFVNYQVSLPMPGRAESLNVAVAAAIMLYEAVRQRFG